MLMYLDGMLYSKPSLKPVPNAQVCVFDGTYYKMMLNDVGVFMTSSFIGFCLVCF
jgi:hypothetical protein